MVLPPPPTGYACPQLCFAGLRTRRLRACSCGRGSATRVNVEFDRPRNLESFPGMPPCPGRVCPLWKLSRLRGLVVWSRGGATQCVGSFWHIGRLAWTAQHKLRGARAGAGDIVQTGGQRREHAACLLHERLEVVVLVRRLGVATRVPAIASGRKHSRGDAHTRTKTHTRTHTHARPHRGARTRTHTHTVALKVIRTHALPSPPPPCPRALASPARVRAFRPTTLHSAATV